MMFIELQVASIIILALVYLAYIILSKTVFFTILCCVIGLGILLITLATRKYIISIFLNINTGWAWKKRRIHYFNRFGNSLCGKYSRTEKSVNININNLNIDKLCSKCLDLLNKKEMSITKSPTVGH